MTPSDRRLLHMLDQMILSASKDELKRIQEIDLKTQMDGLPFYDAYTNSYSIANQNVKRKSPE